MGLQKHVAIEIVRKSWLMVGLGNTFATVENTPQYSKMTGFMTHPLLQFSRTWPNPDSTKARKNASHGLWESWADSFVVESRSVSCSIFCQTFPVLIFLSFFHSIYSHYFSFLMIGFGCGCDILMCTAPFLPVSQYYDIWPLYPCLRIYHLHIDVPQDWTTVLVSNWRTTTALTLNQHLWRNSILPSKSMEELTLVVFFISNRHEGSILCHSTSCCVKFQERLCNQAILIFFYTIPWEEAGTKGIWFQHEKLEKGKRKFMKKEQGGYACIWRYLRNSGYPFCIGGTFVTKVVYILIMVNHTNNELGSYNRHFNKLFPTRPTLIGFERKQNQNGKGCRNEVLPWKSNTGKPVSMHGHVPCICCSIA